MPGKQMDLYIDFRGKKIRYRDTGYGKPVVLLHGYLESLEVWEDFIPGLEEHARVISIDLPGHGMSETHGETHSMELMAGAVLAVIEHLDIEKAFLVGHSMGGYTALAFLELYPESLSAYCLFHSHPFADTGEIIANRLRERKVIGAGKKHVIYPVNVPKMFADRNLLKFTAELEMLKEIASRTPDDGIMAVINGMIERPSRLNLLEEGRVPLLLILGTMDNYVPYDLVLENIKLPPNAELITLADSGHLGFVEEVAHSQSAILEFLQKINQN
jgi:pimeloyl-ACP methyl ester carboxylesterase